MSCNDCLIWVGQSYPTVYKYVREAEERGCCRKVPTWPSWAVPGTTRVFLAHRDVSARTDTGSIFGYFLLSGVDVIFSEQDCQALKELRRAYAQSQDAGDAQKLVTFFKERVPSIRLPVQGISTTGSDGREGGGSRAARGEEADQDRAENPLLDFILDLLIPCEGSPGRPAGAGGGGLVVSADQTSFEQDRWCNGRDLRFHSLDYTPSLYFVDALCQEIDALFCALLKELLKKQTERPKRRGRTTRRRSETQNATANRITREQKTREFDKAKKKAVEAFKQTKVRLPGRLSKLVERHGALLTFKRPYPVYQRMPQAAFKGLIRLDGDQLLDQIISYYARGQKKGTRISRRLVLPICLGREDQSKEVTTKLELVNRAARDLGMDTSLANDVFGWLAGLLGEELRSGRRVRLPEIGTLRIKVAKGNKQVKFKVSQVLRDKVRKGKKKVRSLRTKS